MTMERTLTLDQSDLLLVLELLNTYESVLVQDASLLQEVRDLKAKIRISLK